MSEAFAHDPERAIGSHHHRVGVAPVDGEPALAEKLLELLVPRCAERVKPVSRPPGANAQRSGEHVQVAPSPQPGECCVAVMLRQAQQEDTRWLVTVWSKTIAGLYGPILALVVVATAVAFWSMKAATRYHESGVCGRYKCGARVGELLAYR